MEYKVETVCSRCFVTIKTEIKEASGEFKPLEMKDIMPTYCANCLLKMSEEKTH